MEGYETAKDQIFEKIFLNCKIPQEEMVDKRDFMKQIYQNGILADDPRIKRINEAFEAFDEVKVKKE